MVSMGFTPPSNVRLLGAGKTRTYIKLNAGFIPDPSNKRRYALFFNGSNDPHAILRSRI